MAKRKLHHKAEEYEALRQEGYTYKEIADKVGCSRQNIQDVLARYNASQFKGFSKDRCVYDGLRKWLNENKCSLAELLRRIYGMNVSSPTHTRWASLLRGEHRFTMPDIDAVIDVVGLTYEELFRTEADNG